MHKKHGCVEARIQRISSVFGGRERGQEREAGRENTGIRTTQQKADTEQLLVLCAITLTRGIKKQNKKQRH